jgi:hypothetical protein
MRAWANNLTGCKSSLAMEQDKNISVSIFQDPSLEGKLRGHPRTRGTAIESPEPQASGGTPSAENN